MEENKENLEQEVQHQEGEQLLQQISAEFEDMPSQKKPVQPQTFDVVETAISTAMRTLFFCVALISLFCGLATALFPQQTGTFYYTSGMSARALNQFEKHYARQSEVAVEDDLFLTNRMLQLSIDLLFDARTKNSQSRQNFYAHKVVKYGEHYLSLARNDEYSLQIDRRNIEQASLNVVLDVANHREYVLRGLLQSYIILQRDSDAQGLLTVYFRSNVIERLIGVQNLHDTLKTVKPNWLYGVYMENTFRKIGMKMPAQFPPYDNNISTSNYSVDNFSELFNNNSSSYTALYNMIYDAVEAALKIVEANEVFYTDADTMFACALYLRFINQVAKDMYTFNAIMLSDGRHEFMSYDKHTLITSQMNHFRQLVLTIDGPEGRLQKTLQKYAAALTN